MSADQCSARLPIGVDLDGQCQGAIETHESVIMLQEIKPKLPGRSLPLQQLNLSLNVVDPVGR